MGSSHRMCKGLEVERTVVCGTMQDPVLGAQGEGTKSAAEPLVFRGQSQWGLWVTAWSEAFAWKATGNHGHEGF